MHATTAMCTISLSTSRTLALACCSALLALVASGCNRGPQKVAVSGQLSNQGKPLAVSAKGVVQLILFPYPDVLEKDKPYNSFPAVVDAEGKYLVNDVPVGQYLFTVELLDPYPLNDLLNGAFRKESSKIIRQIDGKAPIYIDLANPEGKWEMTR